MPELPEVETIKNTLAPKMIGAVIKSVLVKQRKFREVIPENFESIATNRKIVSLKRFAKYLLINLDNDYTLIWHFGMSGKFKIESSLPKNFEKHDHIIIETDKAVFIYNDTRRFGLVSYSESKKINEHHLFKKLGLDPWDKNLTAEYLLNKLQNKNVPIKISLLNQEIINGIGNIYASEILYKARIHPQKESSNITIDEANRIIKFTKEILEQAIKAGGSTIHDYKKPDGDIGYFQHNHCVYNRTGQRCPDCNCNIAITGGIQKIVQGGRSTFYCEQLQKNGDNND